MNRPADKEKRGLDGSRDLLQRVAASPHLEKSKRLRDLLLYLGERALQDPNCSLHEQPASVEITSLPESTKANPVRFGFARYATRQYPSRRHSARNDACSPGSGRGISD